MSLRWINGVFRARGFQTVQYEMPVIVPGKPVEVPTVASEPQEHKCTGVFDHEIGQWTCGRPEYHPIAPEPVVVAPEPVPEPEPAPVVVPEPVPEPTVAPEPVPEPEPAVVEVPVVPEPEPVVSEVEAPLEVTEAPAEAGLVPENPPTE
jgi:hypothetical protein